MAKKYDMDVDGYIGSWFSSKRFVKNSLAELGDREILVRVNSPGGSLDDAIDIAARFEAHGKITCELFSLNASAATVLTLGAKKVKMQANAGYFIHKVLSWMDAWGYMNEDDIDAAIERLKTQKESNSTLTLVIAKMYAKKSGKPVRNILNLMKEEKWLNAEEAKEWGFVDEIFEDATVKPANVNDPDITRLLNAAGLPVPVFGGKKATVPAPEETDSHRGTVSAIAAVFREFFNSQNKTVSEMNKTFVSVNTLLAVEGIEFKNGKAELTENQVKTLNDAIAEKTAESKPQEKAVEKTAEDKLAEKDAEIRNLKERIEALNKTPGAETGEVPKQTDTPPAEPKDEIDFKSAKDLYNLLP